MSPAAKRPAAAEEVPEAAPEQLIGLHSLRPAPGSRRPRKRVGRGEGSGTGKTSGRGQKGYGSRAGAKDRSLFEGGQMPIHMRMRKLRGPHKKQSMPFEPFRTHTQPVNVEDLDRVAVALYFFARNDFQAGEQRLGFLAPVRLDPADDNVHAGLFQAMCFFQHRKCFADARRVAEINF